MNHASRSRWSEQGDVAIAGDKYLKTGSNGIPTEQAAAQTSAGAGNAGNIIAANSAGVLDTTFLPTGVGPETISATASEALSAGNLVNLWNNSGTINVRKADATSAGKEAHGFVLASVLSSGTAVVYTGAGQNNTSVSGATPGVQFLATTAGGITATAPSGSGNVVQRVGVATTATNLVFDPLLPIALA